MKFLPGHTKLQLKHGQAVRQNNVQYVDLLAIIYGIVATADATGKFDNTEMH